MKTKTFALFRSLVVSGAAAIFASPSTMALTIDWNSAGTVWGTGSNWSGSNAPADDLITDIAQFNLATYTNQPNANAAARSVNGIIIGATSGATVTITSGTTGNGLSIGASGIDMSAAIANLTLGGLDTNKFTLGADQEWKVNTGRTLTVTGLLGGAQNLAIVGPGTVNLNNTGNTFGGVSNTITVSGGGVVKTNSENSFGGLGSSSNKLILNGGTYIAGGFNDFGTSFDRAIEFQTGGTNNIQAQAGATSREAWFGSALTGDGGFTTVGTGAPIIIGNLAGGSDTLTGTVTSGGQTLYVAANATRDALGGAALNINGGNFHFGGNSGSAVSIANFSRGIAVNSSNGLGAANNYTFTHTGILTGASTLSINNQTTAQEAKGSVAQILAAGVNSVVNLNGDMSGFTGGLNIVNGKLVIGTSATLPATFGAMTFSNATGVNLDLNGRSITVKGLVTGGTLGGNIQGNSTGSANTLTTDTTGTDRSYAGIISDGGSVTLNIAKIGSNTQTLTGANTYTGTTTVAVGGALNIRHATALGSTVAGTSVADGAALQIQGSIAVGAEALSLTGTGITNSGALRNMSESNLYAGAITLGGATRINSDTANTTLTLSGGISGTDTNLTLGGTGNTHITNSFSIGTGSLTKDGTGTLKLSAANTYSGGTTVSAGTLIATNASCLGATSSLAITGGSTFAYQPTAAGPLNLGTGTINLVNTNKIGTALGGTAGQSAITSSVAATTSGTVTVNIYGIPGATVTTGSNDLITAASGLNGATYTLGTITNASNFTVTGLTKTDTAVSINATGVAPLTNEYWKGGYAGAAGTWAVTNGNTASNWASDSGGTATSLTPGSGTTINFTGTATGNKTMTLGASMSVAGIFVSDPVATTLSADAYTLTLGTGGITVDSGAGAVSLAAPIALNGDQTWVNNATTLLSVTGGTLGSGNLVLNNGNATASGITLSAVAIDHAGTITNSGAGNGSTLISAAIGENVTDVIQNSATSQLTLSGGNLFATAYTATLGTLSISNTATFANASQFDIASGGRLEVAAANANLSKLATANGGSGVIAGSFLRYSANQSTASASNGPGTILGTLELNAATITANYALSLGTGSTLQTLINSAFTPMNGSSAAETDEEPFESFEDEEEPI